MASIKPVPASQWDAVYGNGDGELSLDERGVATAAEAVLARHPIALSLKTDRRQNPKMPYRAGNTWRDEFGKMNVRIYPGAVGMTPALIPYVVGHEIGHAVLGHLDGAQSSNVELEADRFAGLTLAETGEGLDATTTALLANGDDSDTHGSLSQRIDALQAGYADAQQPPPAPAVPAARPRHALARLSSALGNWFDAVVEH